MMPTDSTSRTGDINSKSLTPQLSSLNNASNYTTVTDTGVTNTSFPCSLGLQSDITNKTSLEKQSDDVIDSETRPLLGDVSTRVYTRRWYMLAIFSLLSALQGAGWGTWGPITQTAKAVFRWTDSSVALMPLWGKLGFVCVMVPVTWFMGVKGWCYCRPIICTFVRNTLCCLKLVQTNARNS